MRASMWCCGLLLSAVVLSACGADLGDCPQGSDARQGQGRLDVEDNCVYCHSATSKGVQRMGAPAGLDWDDLGAVRDWRDTMWTWIDDGNMPPPSTGATLPADTKENIRVWLACGARDVPTP